MLFFSLQFFIHIFISYTIYNSHHLLIESDQKIKPKLIYLFYFSSSSMDNSSACNNYSAKNSDNSQEEESSWTFYFQDFMSNNNNNYEQNYSLCSDELFINKNNVSNINENSNSNNNNNKFVLKKRKMKGVAVDDDLEDTASSPVNSPKVSYMDEFCIKSQKGKNSSSILEGKGNSISGQQMMTSGLNISTNKENDSTELKKKGLCLVPISMFTK